MPELMVEIPIKEVAYLINKMNKQELETLYMLLTEDGEELLKRNKDLKSKKAKYLNRDDVFDV